jgi:hypothetical protein
LDMGLEAISAVLNLLLGVISTILPAIGVPPEFFIALDAGLSLLLDIIITSAWFVPLDILVMCFTVMLVADNYILLSKLVRWVVGLIRGSG